MDLQIRPFLLKPQWMNGLSERLLVSHYVNNYGGALRRLNAIRARLASIDWAQAPTFEINGLKREELIASGLALRICLCYGKGRDGGQGRRNGKRHYSRAHGPIVGPVDCKSSVPRTAFMVSPI